MSALISAETLARRMGAVRIINATWHLPNAGRNAAAEHAERAIEGAVFWDINAISDFTSPYPHMLPSPTDFAQHMQRLGIRAEDDVVIYDDAGLFSAARAWWSLKAMGHQGEVLLLDGGLPAWLAAGHPTTAGSLQPAASSAPYHTTPNPQRVATVSDVSTALETGAAQMLDARAAARFAGHAPEPRPGVRAGHMPGAINLPFQALLTTNAPVRLLPPDTLRAAIMAHGASLEAPTITSCGSGVTACILALAWEEAGLAPVRVYDGSWAEWGARVDLPLATLPQPAA